MGKYRGVSILRLRDKPGNIARIAFDDYL